MHWSTQWQGSTYKGLVGRPWGYFYSPTFAEVLAVLGGIALGWLLYEIWRLGDG